MSYKHIILFLVIAIIVLSIYLYKTVSPDKRNEKWYNKILK